MVGHPMLIAGDLSADSAVILCLSKGISAGRFIDLALAYSRGLVFLPTLLVGAVGRLALVDVGISLSDVPMLLLHLMLVMSLIGGSPLISLLLLASVLMLGWLMLLVRLFVSLSGLHVVWTLLIGPPRRLLVLFKMSGMFTGMNWVRFLGMLCLLLGMLSLVHLLMIFGLFVVEVCYAFVAGVWEAELLAAGDPVGFFGLVMVMRLMCIVLSTL